MILMAQKYGNNRTNVKAITAFVILFFANMVGNYNQGDWRKPVALL